MNNMCQLLTNNPKVLHKARKDYSLDKSEYAPQTLDNVWTRGTRGVCDEESYKRQTIISTNDDLFYCHIHASLDINELRWVVSTKEVFCQLDPSDKISMKF